MRVSVLVPIYGVEKYITRCAESLMTQTFQDMEFIFVDDCSPDHSIEKLQAVTTRYPNRAIKVLRHSSNRGLGASRKTLLEAAEGEYVLAVDSDDYLDTDAVEQLIHIADKEKADIVAMDMWFEWGNKKKAYHADTAADKDTYTKMLLSGQVLPGLCRHLIRKTLYTDYHLHPQEGLNNAEDYSIMPRLSYMAQRIAYTNHPLYHYTQNNTTSYTHQLNNRNLENLVEATKLLNDFFEDKQDYQEALQQGFWQKKTDNMMRAKKRDYSIMERIPTHLPIQYATIPVEKRVATLCIAHKWYNGLWLYGRCYAIGMALLQWMKGR